MTNFTPQTIIILTRPQRTRSTYWVEIETTCLGKELYSLCSRSSVFHLDFCVDGDFTKWKRILEKLIFPAKGSYCRKFYPIFYVEICRIAKWFYLKVYKKKLNRQKILWDVCIKLNVFSIRSKFNLKAIKSKIWIHSIANEALINNMEM